jgi:shikimate dehydrogenase
MIDGHTKLVGLIGWPVEHSLSPLMHNAAFDALGLNWRYVPLPVPPGQVEVAIRGLAALGFCGANVTVPHKQAVMPVLDSISPNARALGAVNTLLLERDAGGELLSVQGYNTDDAGFVSALRQHFPPLGGTKGGDAVVVGAGGAARAVVFGLLGAGSGQITVLNRSPRRARELTADLARSPACAARLRALPLTPETLIESARAASLLVNATPVGMWPRVDDSIWPDVAPLPSHLTVFDLVYNPLQTRLLRQAQRAGARPIDGLGMLIHQGAIAFKIWTGAATVNEITTLMRAALLP